MTPLLESLQASFTDLPWAAVDAGGLGELRRSAILRALAEGLPTQRDERWKYTSLRPLSARRFVAAAIAPLIHPATLEDIPAPRLVFVNGELDPALSSIPRLPPGLSIETLGRRGFSPDALDLFSPPPNSPHTLTHLNTALSHQGAIIHVAPDTTVDTPVHLVFLGAPATADIASHLRHGITLGANAKLSLVEHHIALGAHRHLGNHMLRIQLDEGATLTHARMQDEDAGATLFARTDATLAAGALYHRVDLELGGALSRHELNVELRGGNARFLSGGALLAGGRRHVDTRLRIEHCARDTRCDLLWRGLAADRGRVAFHGGILIHAGADGSDARLSNKNLLLSDNAEIDTQPVLEIHADEVKAAHGATVGRLDEKSLFYLRSRGIPVAQARALLTLAFCREALASIGDAALIEALSPRLEARLAELETVE